MKITEPMSADEFFNSKKSSGFAECVVVNNGFKFGELIFYKPIRLDFRGAHEFHVCNPKTGERVSKLTEREFQMYFSVATTSKGE